VGNVRNLDFALQKYDVIASKAQAKIVCGQLVFDLLRKPEIPSKMELDKYFARPIENGTLLLLRDQF